MIVGYLKLFHVLFIFTWLGGLLATTRMVGYLAKEERVVQRQSLKLWRRLYFLVDLPSMCLALATGVVLLIWKDISMKQMWLHLKLTAAFFLVVADLTVGFLLTKSGQRISRGYEILFRVLHVVVALLLIAALFSIYVLKIK